MSLAHISRTQQREHVQHYLSGRPVLCPAYEGAYICFSVRTLDNDKITAGTITVRQLSTVVVQVMESQTNCKKTLR